MFLNQNVTELLSDSDCKFNQPDSSKFNHNIEHVLDHLMRKAVNKVSDKPLKYPHRLIHHQFFIQVPIQRGICSFEYIPENAVVHL
jgi:hypothetical protein